ncbi:hypothetical protein [Halostella sp. PRR32]|uniref:hypothetical protein n=1 Tax=Halostella sp. PRR32 TaxID=3098147 RepID=UPI002B1E45B7|nr:hypothetical protein [Halostella sp. PRR32]
MSVTDMFRGRGTDSRLYFAIGGLSLLKAFVLRNDRQRFRSELKDAAMFLAVGLFLRRAEQRRTDKVADIDMIRQEVKRRFGGGQTKQSGGLRSRLGRGQQTQSRSLPERLFGR